MFNIISELTLINAGNVVSLFKHAECFEAIRYIHIDEFKTELTDELTNTLKGLSECPDNTLKEKHLNDTIGKWISIEESFETGFKEIFFYGGNFVSIDKLFDKVKVFLKKHEKGMMEE